jgi:HD-GYP domain-containing protein (c-di-GMP phosphodiesterase class II)
MELGTVLSLTVSLFSTIAAILAWVAKLRWSNEYISAKDEIIRAKEAQISSLENEVRFLREITSPKIHEYFTSVKSQLEEYLDLKDDQLEATQNSLRYREEQIAQMQHEWETQKSNIEWELNSGIGITLEGWAYSLELRNIETEGHIQRVTDMTTMISKAMGIPEEELIHIRRGALLHDIGKLRIPDSILMKSSKLTDEEWEILRQHPVYSNEILSQIEYLQSALDIPYCHHEKWDGSGYPRGLKGKDIPLAARIFAVVDIWDALGTDRPYRSGLSTEKIVEYLNEQSGNIFDPEVVDTFIKILIDDE